MRSDPTRSPGQLPLHGAGMASSLLLICFHLQPGVRPQINAAVFCGTAAGQINTAGASLGPRAAAARVRTELCGWVGVLHGQHPGDVLKRIWHGPAGCWQFPVWKESANGVLYFCSFIVHPATDLGFVLCCWPL